MPVDPELERRALRVLEQIIELPVTERPGQLDELCGGDVALRGRVTTLLARARDGDLELDQDPAAVSALFEDEPVVVGGRIGSYEIVRLVGRGGMGEVYEARQREPERTVAIKVLRRGVFGADARRRFRIEARLLANLKHPAIAQIIEAGVHVESSPTGEHELPFVALEYVDGARSITDYVEEERLPRADRVRLLIAVASAVQHGHQKGVIHRDLKPANLLVGSDGRPRVIDFGVARVTDESLAQPTFATQAGQVVGTLGFIAPENLAGEVEVADVRADVYALGAVAYRLLLGRSPFDLDGVALAEAARRVTTESPLRPRAAVAAFDPDLEAVLLQAVAREPADRYPSAQALADDLERWLASEPVQARRPSTLRRLRLFVRRNPPLFAALAAILLLVVGGSIGFAAMQASARERAEDLRAIAERNGYFSDIIAANAMVKSGETSEAVATLQRAAEPYRAWEHRHLTRTIDTSVRTLRPFPALGPGAANLGDCDVDGDRVVVGNGRGEVKVLAIADGAELRGWRLDGDATWVRFARAGSCILNAGRQDGVVRLIDIAGGAVEELHRFAEPVTIHGLEVSRDGERGVCIYTNASMRDGGLVVFDLAERRVNRMIAQERTVPMSAAFSRGGRFLFAGTFRGRVERWDLDGAAESGPMTLTDAEFAGHGNAVGVLEVSPDGASVLSGGGARLAVWDAQSLELELVIETDVGQAAWDEDSGRLFVAERASPQVFVAALEPGQPRRFVEGLGHLGPVSRLRCLALGSFLTCAVDGTIRIWDARRLSSQLELKARQRTTMTVAAAGSRVVSVSNDGSVYVWDRSTGAVLERFDVGGRVLNVAAHPVRSLFAINGAKGAFLLSLEDGSLRSVGASDHSIGDVAWLPGGAAFVTSENSGRLTVRDSEGELLHERVSESGSPIRALAVSTDGSRVLTGAMDGELIEWAAVDLRRLRALPRMGAVAEVAYVPGSRGHAVSMGVGQVLMLWERQPDGSLVGRKLDAGRYAERIVFHPREPRMFVCTLKGDVTIWDTDLWRRLVTINGHRVMILGASFNAATDELVTGAMDGVVKIWQVAPR